VNKSKLALSLLVLALAGAGCDKPVDLGRMQEETLGILKLHATQAELLQRRADAIATRARNAGGEAGVLADASTAGFPQLRAQLQNASATLATAVKSGDPEQVQHVSDDLLDKLDKQEVEIRANLAAVDNRLGALETRPRVMAPPPPAPTPEPSVMPTDTAPISSPPPHG
jgi:small-conductance mechanosensitive channel